jgi:phospholipase D1/2
MPSTARDEHKPDDQGQEHEPRGGEASANFLSAKTVEETLGNGHTRSGGASKHEKSITEKSTGPLAGEKTGGLTPTEKANGSATNDKGKKTRGEPPFTKQEREEMEALLDELCGHLGRFSRISLFCRCSLVHAIYSHLSNPILGRRRRREQLLVQHRQATTSANI